jgi:hypothetical protein
MQKSQNRRRVQSRKELAGANRAVFAVVSGLAMVLAGSDGLVGGRGHQLNRLDQFRMGLRWAR